MFLGLVAFLFAVARPTGKLVEPVKGEPMARRRRRSTSTQIIRAVPVRAPAPIIRVSAPSAPRKQRHHRRRRGGGDSKRTIISAGIGGAALGFLEKTFGASLPAVPIIGRKGTVTLAAYVLRNRLPFLRDVALAGAAICGYELGKDGHVSGDIASQAHGVATQL